MSSLTLQPAIALSGQIHLPGSKSISNRALVLASMAKGDTEIHNLLRSDDTQYMLSALTQLGIHIDDSHPEIIRVRGTGGPLVGHDQFQALNLGLAGTALRPLAAALTLGQGRFTLDGNARMRERPVAHLVDGLRQLGASINYLAEDGFPPLEIHGTGLAGGTARIPGDISSQFLTSILLAAPMAQTPVTVEVDGVQVSKPYLDITLGMLRQFGADASHTGHARYQVNPGNYTSPERFLVEGDASAATYFLAAGAISGSGITVHGLGSDSVQGDIDFLEVLREMGATVVASKTSVTTMPGKLVGIDRDLNHIPDAAMTVAMLALFAEGTTTIRNIYNWRVKETDRLDAVCRELRKLGAEVEEGRDFLSITPPEKLKSATIDTYGDHRMAMCFSLATLDQVAVTINEPECVAKTFPNYFTEFARLTIPA